MRHSAWLLCFLVPAAILLPLAAAALEPPTSSTEQDVPEDSTESSSGDAATSQTTIRDKIVVSAARVELPARNVGSSVTVIDREEIERRRQTTVLELLRTVPGLEVVRNGGPGQVASVFIRGGNSAHTLVLVDKIRVNSNTDGAFNFTDLTVDNIERIEILRGPQGSLYGSEAVSGVVSIMTRRGEGSPSFWAGGELGTHGHSRLRTGVSGAAGPADYNLTVARTSTDAVSAASEDAGNLEDDPWENLTVSGRFGSRFSGNGQVDLVLRYADGDAEIDGFTFGVGPSDDLNARQRQETLAAALTVSKPLSARWTQTFFLGSTRNELVGVEPDGPFGNFEITSDTLELSLQSDLVLADWDTLSFGYRIEKREGANLGSYDGSLYLRSFFLENSWSWSARHHFTLSARHDDHSEFGSETTYRFTTSLKAGRDTRLHGSFGTGFKAPTFDDLFFPGFGNLDLRPETSAGFDLGIEQILAGGRISLDLTYFDTDFEDLIQFTFPQGFVNVAEAASEGYEVALRWEPAEGLLLRASHTRTDARDRATGLQLPRRPEHRSAFEVAFRPAERLRGSATLIAVRDRVDFDGSPMDDYERVDVTLEYRTGPSWRPYLRLENLLDEDYAEVPGFTSPGISATIGLEAEF